MNSYPESLIKLIDALQNLPGVGKKTAERYAFDILDWPPEKQTTLMNSIHDVHENIQTCSVCGCLQEGDECQQCNLQKSDPHSLIIVAHPKEVYALMHLHVFKGYFHVLGGLLSPLDGIDPDMLNIQHVKDRIASLGITEVVLALDTTLEGEATTLYLKQELKKYDVQLSQLAHGLPSGSPLEYVDESTLHQAFAGRHTL